MKKSLLIPVLLVGAVLVGGWYALSPEGPLGYDEGTRLVAHTAKAAADLRRSGDSASTLVYSPKYGDDQAIHIEFTPGDLCLSPSRNCQGTTVVVRVAKGKSGAGYGLGESVAVPRRLSLDKAHGPIEVGLARQGDTIVAVSLR